MLLVLFIGSLLPYIEGLDSWLFDGILDDPYEEVIVVSVLLWCTLMGTHAKLMWLWMYPKP